MNTSNNRLGVPNGQSGTMTYDSAGNLTTDTYSGYGQRAYDAENRMTSAQDSYSGWSYYTYNADGQRVRRKINNVETWAIYGMDGEMLAEYPMSGATTSPQKEYGYRNGQLLVTSGGLFSGTQNVTWGNVVGVTVNNNSLSKTGASSWNAGAVSSQSITSGDGYVQFTASETTTDRIIGLSNGDTNQNYTDVDFGFYLGPSGYLYIYEAGVYRAFAGFYATGDTLKVAVEAGVVKYRKNGNLVYTSGVTPTYPLLVDTALYTQNSTINNVVISGNLSTDGVHWLVSDQLGTPRMIVDQTGTLANLKRHDYLPFGEELYGGTDANPRLGGRRPGLGYGCGQNCVPDGVRQQFTSKERDGETGLDYFGARYFTSTHGRFTSSDPLNASARTQNPQSWNRYSYVLNRPISLIDPNGMSDADPDYRPEFRPCSVGIDAGCSADSTVLAGVTITFSTVSEITQQDIEISNSITLRETQPTIPEKEGSLYAGALSQAMQNRVEPMAQVLEVGAVVATAEIAAPVIALEAAGAGVASLGIEAASVDTAVIGSEVNRAAYVGQTGFNVLRAADYTWKGGNLPWLHSVVTSGQSVIVLGGSYYTEQEVQYLMQNAGYIWNAGGDKLIPH